MCENWKSGRWQWWICISRSFINGSMKLLMQCSISYSAKRFTVLLVHSILAHHLVFTNHSSIISFWKVLFLYPTYSFPSYSFSCSHVGLLGAIDFLPMAFECIMAVLYLLLDLFLYLSHSSLNSNSWHSKSF